MRPVTRPILAEIAQTDLDPAGFVYADIRSVTDDQGAATDPSNRGQPLGTTVDTSRTLYVGDRVVLRCWGNDSHGRGLRWWLHPQGCGRQLEVRGDRVELTWVVQSGTVGDRAYGVWHPQPAGTDVGVGMAADSRYHRHGGPDEEGYDGWVVFYYRVQPIPPDAGTRGRRRATNPAGSGRAVAHRPRQSDDVSPDRRGVVTVTRR